VKIAYDEAPGKHLSRIFLFITAQKAETGLETAAEYIDEL
jgi:hypothetical protein